MRRPTDGKDTNPKDAVATNKLPLHLVPDILTVFAALGFTEGAAKYGAFNFRVAGARFSVYSDALERHHKKLKAGEWADKKTGVPHLASMLACIGIILDAWLVDKLVDDRPPMSPRMSEVIDAMEMDVARVRSIFADKSPHHHTIADAKPALKATVDAPGQIRPAKRSRRRK